MCCICLFSLLTCQSEAVIDIFHYGTSILLRLHVVDFMFLPISCSSWWHFLVRFCLDFFYSKEKQNYKAIIFQPNSQLTIIRGGGASCSWMTTWANKWETRMFMWSFVGLTLYLHVITCFCQPTKCSFILSFEHHTWVKNTCMLINTRASLACRSEPKHAFKNINNHSPLYVST